MTGMRPVVDIMFGDFLTLIMDQLVNQAAKIRYMSGGHFKAPLTVRTTLGATRRSAAQHSQSLHAWVAHIPGLKVAMPATPADAKGLMKAAIRDDNPVVIFEDKMNFATKGPVPDDEDFVIPLGVADVKRVGDDITIVATSSMVYVALEAAELLARGRDLGRGGRPADARAARSRRPRRARRERRAGRSSSTRATRATAPPRSSPRRSPTVRSGSSTRPSSAPEQWTCPSRSRRCSRTRPCRRANRSTSWRRVW